MPRVISAINKMKIIKQTEEVLYTTPTFQDAIVMLPLMDQVYNDACKEITVKAYHELPEEERKLYRTPWTGNVPNAEKIYKLLISMGFCTSHGNPLEVNLEKKPVREA